MSTAATLVGGQMWTKVANRAAPSSFGMLMVRFGGDVQTALPVYPKAGRSVHDRHGAEEAVGRLGIDEDKGAEAAFLVTEA